MHHAREGIELAPAFLPSYWALAIAHLAMGEYLRAAEPLERALQLYRGSTFTLALLGAAEAFGGHEQEARGRLEQLDALAGEAYVAPSHRSLPWIALGDYDRAFALLHQAAEERDTLPLYLTTSPVYAPIRGDQRYEALLEKIRLGNQNTATATLPGTHTT